MEMMCLFSALVIFTVFLIEIETADWNLPNKLNLGRSHSKEDRNRLNMPDTPDRRHREDMSRSTKRSTPPADFPTQYYGNMFPFPSSPIITPLNSHDPYHREYSQPLHSGAYTDTHSNQVNEQEAFRMGRQHNGDYPPFERDLESDAYRMAQQRYGKIPPLIDLPTNKYGTAPTGTAGSSGHSEYSGYSKHSGPSGPSGYYGPSHSSGSSGSSGYDHKD